MENVLRSCCAGLDIHQKIIVAYRIEYAQTFIIPTTIELYDIEPYGASLGETIKTMKAFVR